jgi:pilus assembly protein CpaF
MAQHYAVALVDKNKTEELKAYIGKYLYDTGYSVDGYESFELVERLFDEMAGYSILTKHLVDPNLEEININGWDDVALTHLDGRIEKAEEHFFSPQHAVDVVKKLLQHSGMIIDNAAPIAQGHLPNNTRITALKEPIVDADRGIAVSIRMLHPERIDRDSLLAADTISDKMFSFMEICLRY